MNKATSVEDHRLSNSFHSLRKTLLQDAFADRMNRPLAFWALPNDRRLPLAFLGGTLRELLHTPFEELAATHGIGQKKISTLMKLLTRATKDYPPAGPFGTIDPAVDKRQAMLDKLRSESTFDPMLVSEALWEQWRDTVKERGVGSERLGRLAVTLQVLPTVIWHTPLEAYLHCSLAEMRQLRTHGEKRVRAILEVYCSVHEVLSNVPPQSHLNLRLVPKFILSVERWIGETMNRDDVPTPDEVRQALTAPLVTQIEVDAGPAIVHLAEGRLGIAGPPQTVRQQAKAIGVTRARIYQLLDDCARVMAVRWPEGRWQLSVLLSKLEARSSVSRSSAGDNLDLFRATAELFFPESANVADSEMEESD